jgi:type IV pilus assembly protein PilA
MVTTSSTARGFTLIELMIVVAIVGLLAAIAIPAYQAHIAKSQLAEAFELVSSVKGSIADYYGQTSAWPSNGTAGIPAATSISGHYVRSVTVSNADGSITVTLQSTGVSDGLKGKDLIFTPGVTTGSIVVIHWTCTTSIRQAYVPPAACLGT